MISASIKALVGSGAMLHLDHGIRRHVLLTNRKVAWLGIVVLATLSVVYLIVPFFRIGLHISLLPNEGWNAQWSVQALGGGLLYPERGAFVFNNYPPLSFYVIGLVGTAFDDNILAGRLISIGAVVIIAFNIFLTVRNLGGTALFGLLAGVLFVGILSKSYVEYVGTNEPQLLAHAFMITGFSVLTTSPRAIRHVVLASLLMVLAGFTKHNIFAMPLAVTTWLLQNDRRTLRSWISFSTAFILIGFAASGIFYGTAFFEQLLLPRKYSLFNVAVLLGWLQTIIIPLVLWAVFVRQAPTDPRLRLVSHLLIAGGVVFVVNRSGENVSINSLFDWVIGASIAAGVMISRISEASLSHRYGEVATRGLIVAALCLRMILLPQKEIVELVLHPNRWNDLQAVDAAFRTDVAVMRGRPGPTVCENLSLCYRSGHLSAYDHINAPGAFKAGARDIEILRKQIVAGQYQLVQLFPESPLLSAARASGLSEHSGSNGAIIFYGGTR